MLNAKYVQKWLKINDTLEVWRAHGVGGMTGAILIGVTASSNIGVVSASAYQLGIQVLAVVIVAAYAWIITMILLKILDAFGHLRVPDEVQLNGLDNPLYGENAFNLWGMKRHMDK